MKHQFKNARVHGLALQQGLITATVAIGVSGFDQSTLIVFDGIKIDAHAAGWASLSRVKDMG
jgi:hypothetical protein